jgi:hypothetical protein
MSCGKAPRLNFRQRARNYTGPFFPISVSATQGVASRHSALVRARAALNGRVLALVKCRRKLGAALPRPATKQCRSPAGELPGKEESQTGGTRG